MRTFLTLTLLSSLAVASSKIRPEQIIGFDSKYVQRLQYACATESKAITFKFEIQVPTETSWREALKSLPAEANQLDRTTYNWLHEDWTVSEITENGKPWDHLTPGWNEVTIKYDGEKYLNKFTAERARGHGSSCSWTSWDDTQYSWSSANYKIEYVDTKGSARVTFSDPQPEAGDRRHSTCGLPKIVDALCELRSIERASVSVD